MAAGEKKLINEFLLNFTKLGSRLFRVHAGLFYSGKVQRGPSGAITIQNARPVKVGQPGMSDLIGWTQMRITDDMVGTDVAIFTAIEVKAGKTRVSKEQQSFVNIVTQSGGVACVARSWQDIQTTMEGYIERTRAHKKTTTSPDSLH